MKSDRLLNLIEDKENMLRLKEFTNSENSETVKNLRRLKSTIRVFMRNHGLTSDDTKTYVGVYSNMLDLLGSLGIDMLPGGLSCIINRVLAYIDP